MAADGVGPATKEFVDLEARGMVDECYSQAVATLREHREQLTGWRTPCSAAETLDEDDAYAAAGITQETAPASAPSTTEATCSVIAARLLPGRPVPEHTRTEAPRPVG